MDASRIFLACVLLVLSLGACHRDRCLSVCEQRRKELGCTSSDRCKATCNELHEASPCAAAMRAWEDCIVSLATDQWECDDRGQPVPRQVACPEARGKVVSCISKFPQWPLPKK